MKVLVTGGGGFIGSHIVRKLSALGHEIEVVEHNVSAHKRAKFVQAKAKIIVGDVQNVETWEKMSQLDAIISLACLPRSQSLEHPDLDLEVNYRATILGLECARRNKACFIFASNAINLDQPQNSEELPITFYDANKLASERLLSIYARKFDVPTLVCRLSAVYGPGQLCHSGWHPLIPHFFMTMAKGEAPVIYGDGEQSRDFVYVDDVVAGIIAAFRKLSEGSLDAEGQAVVLASGSSVSVNRIYSSVAKRLKFAQEARHDTLRKLDVRQTRFEPATEGLIDWAPSTTFEDGLSLTLDWLASIRVDH